MDINPDKLFQIKAEAETLYKTFGDVYCPYLKDRVAFNAKGLDHIKLKEFGKIRPAQDQYMRLRLLRIAPQILKESNTLQEFFETNRVERQRINSRWDFRMVKVSYYGFVAIINTYRIKIVVKEIEGGKKYFWSLIPFWKTRPDAINSHKKILHEGDLETQ